MGRLIHFANIPLRLVQPAMRENITEIVFRTIPSTTKVEIKRILESLYGLSVERVDTCNYEGKKKRHRHGFYRRPDYKKAFVSLKEPVTLPEELFVSETAEEGKAGDQKSTGR